MKHHRQLALLLALVFSACADNIVYGAANAQIAPRGAEAGNVWNAFLIPGRGLYMEYELLKGDTDGGRDWFGMDITPAANGAVSIHFTGEVDAAPFDIEVPSRTNRLLMPIAPRLRQSPASEPIAAMLLSPWWYMHFNKIKLDIGKEIIKADCGGLHKIEVVDRCSFAGVEGVFVRWSDQSHTKSELCINPGLPVPLMVRVYGDNGEPEREMHLTGN